MENHLSLEECSKLDTTQRVISWKQKLDILLVMPRGVSLVKRKSWRLVVDAK